MEDMMWNPFTKKYRIVKIDRTYGPSHYLQERFLGLFWINLLNVGSIREGEEAYHRQIHKNKTTVVKELP